MNDALFLLDKTDIARLLRVKEKTVVERRSANPETLPPVCRVPGNRQPLWRKEDVDKWLAKCVEGSEKFSRAVPSPPTLR